jgi:hypothetical protein
VSDLALDGFRAPDLIEPLLGFRQWRLRDGNLQSPYSNQRWTRADQRATCPVSDHEPTDIPSERCSCGIYAYYEPCPRMASSGTRDLVGGVVILWGRIEVHGTGMRAACARIVALELPLTRGRKRRRVMEIADGLGVPAVPHRKLKTVGAELGSPLPSSMRPESNWASGLRYPPISRQPTAANSWLMQAARDRGVRIRNRARSPFAAGQVRTGLGGVGEQHHAANPPQR